MVTQVTLTDSERQVHPYDFQRRDALERARLRLLQPILEVVTHRIAGSLTTMLRTPVKVGIGELEQQRWEEYVNSLPEPTFLTGASVVPTGGRIILHLPLPLAMTLIEIRLGGTGGTPIPERSLTEIEQRLVTEVAHGVLAELPPAFSPAMGITMGAISSVSSGMFLPGSTPSEMCLLVGLEVELNESVTEVASICMPLVVLLPILDAIERLDKVENAEEVGVAPTRLPREAPQHRRRDPCPLAGGPSLPRRAPEPRPRRRRAAAPGPGSSHRSQRRGLALLRRHPHESRQVDRMHGHRTINVIEQCDTEQ